MIDYYFMLSSLIFWVNPIQSISPVHLEQFKSSITKRKHVRPYNVFFNMMKVQDLFSISITGLGCSVSSIILMCQKHFLSTLKKRVTKYMFTKAKDNLKQ